MPDFGPGMLTTVCVVLALAGFARAEPGTDPATAAACRAVATAAPPETDKPTAAQQRTLSGCDAEALYYGIGRPANPKRARLCAFVQQAHRGALDPLGFSADELLMVIYANGVGARREFAYATRLACESWAAPAETDARVANLANKQRSHWTGHDFSWCDNITSGVASGACAAHEQRIVAQANQGVLNRLVGRLFGPTGARFAELRAAQAAWSKVRGEQEVDLSGRARAEFVSEEEQLQDKDLLEMLSRIQSGHPPRLAVADLRAADARINELYRRVQAQESGTLQGGTVTKASVRQVQLVWLRYRDAWGAFAGAAYPDWGVDAAAAWVTMKRADMLSAFLQP